MPKNKKTKIGQVAPPRFVAAVGSLVITWVIAATFSTIYLARAATLPGDLNSDNNVDVTDLSILLSVFGTADTRGDVNGNGSVDIQDLSALLSNFGNTATGGLVAPTGLTAVGGQGKITLDWADNQAGTFNYYAVRRATTPDVNNEAAWTRLPGNHTASAYDDSDPALVPGATYYYYVTAVVDGATYSGRSNTASASPTGSATPGPSPSPNPSPGPLPPGTTQGTLLWNGDFSTGNLSQYASVQACGADRVTVINDPMGLPRKAAKFTVYDSDVSPCTPTDNPRAQILGPNNIQLNGDYWIGYSVLIPSNIPSTTASGDNWITLHSVYGLPFDANTNGINEAMNLNPGSQMFYSRLSAEYQFKNAWTYPMVKGKWVDVVIHLRMSTNATVGFKETWINTGSGWQMTKFANGQTRYYVNTVNAANGGGPNHSKLTFYRRKGIMGVGTIYYAGHKVGSGFGSVAPKSY